jgi:hypothetical protein
MPAACPLGYDGSSFAPAALNASRITLARKAATVVKRPGCPHGCSARRPSLARRDYTAAPRRRHAAYLPRTTILLVSLAGCVAPERGPLSAWVVSESTGLTADSTPLPENDVASVARGRIQLIAAIHETIGFQIALRTIRPPAGPFDVRISDLRGADGTLPSAKCVRVFRARPTRVARFASWYPEHVGQPALPANVPDVLVPWDAPRGGGPLRLDDGSCQFVWIDLAVPSGTDPGEYVGRAEVVSAGPVGAFETPPPPILSLELHLRVMPVALPEEGRLPAICRVDPRDLLEQHLRWPRVKPEQLRLVPTAPSHLTAVHLVNETMRLFHDHRAAPVLWASFPKYRPQPGRGVEVDWGPYDELVSGWLDGSAFADRVALTTWPIPASADHPGADENGGLDSPRYARLLADYLRECQRHFTERGWSERAWLRLIPPAPLTPRLVAAQRRTAGIVRDAGVGIPLVGHLPADSLRPLGWHDAPQLAPTEMPIWAPPASWFVPDVMQRARQLGRQTWFVPDYPPFSGALAPATLPADMLTLAWQAYRYDASAIWIEDAAAKPEGAEVDAPLVYPGVPYGLLDRPVPTIRLKRLRRGLQDHALLWLLESTGHELLARRTAEQVVPRAFADACTENLLHTRGQGWITDAYSLGLARRLILQELANAFAPTASDRQEQAANIADWERVLGRATGARVETTGVRVGFRDQQMLATVFATCANDTDRPLHGRWQVPQAPTGWLLEESRLTVPPEGYQLARVAIRLDSLMWNPDGVFPFEMQFATGQLGSLPAAGRLAVALCPLVAQPPAIDGDPRDWPRSSDNSAGDFQLVRGRAQLPGSGSDRAPSLPTRAFFCRDETNLYIFASCGLRADEPPQWEADNEIPVDGAIPWGQDVLEILIDPQNLSEGTPADLYCIQVKPSGMLVARQGCRTQPPLAPIREWPCGARVAVGRTPQAWTVELGLPLASLGPPATRNRVWGVNIARLDARRGEYSSWSGARGDCYAPQRLGNLLLP